MKKNMLEMTKESMYSQKERDVVSEKTLDVNQGRTPKMYDKRKYTEDDGNSCQQQKTERCLEHAHFEKDE